MAGTKKFDGLLYGSATLVIAAYIAHIGFGDLMAHHTTLFHLTHALVELVNIMWWGILIGVVMIAILGRIPREFVISALAANRPVAGILRACLVGVLLDLCNHGILMVASKLYERGASIGQVIAFLVASPWNSFSLTLILVALIGLPWTLAFIFLSMTIAITTGLAFDKLVDKGLLPENPNHQTQPENFQFWKEARTRLRGVRITLPYLFETLRQGLMESRMVMRWILFGILLASFIRTFVSPSLFESLFAPTLAGLGLTLLFATIIEVCSEGSAPIASDIMHRAGASGNSFAFLMSGVATDYTEIMVLKDTTKHWRVALALPAITLPQIAIVALILNLSA